jgi:hypothetical protein
MVWFLVCGILLPVKAVNAYDCGRVIYEFGEEAEILLQDARNFAEEPADYALLVSLYAGSHLDLLKVLMTGVSRQMCKYC